jgi:hypothetical protein
MRLLNLYHKNFDFEFIEDCLGESKFARINSE